MSTWTGGLLGQGGVAWCKLFDQPNATYGVHAGAVTLWNRSERACLRITPDSPAGGHVATRRDGWCFARKWTARVRSCSN